MEIAKLIEGHLRSILIEHEPPDISEHGSSTNISPYDHISEEQPSRNEGFGSLSRLAAHHVMVRRIEGECCSRESIRDEVDPQKLDWDQCFRET